MDSRPRLVCIPSQDADFAAHANRLLGVIERSPAGLDTPGELERRLRLTYPTAVVRARHPLAGLSPLDAPVWYVTKRSYASRIEASLDISADRDRVFDIYVRRMPEWQVALRLRPVDHPTGTVGIEYVAEYKLMGRTLRGRLRVTGADPPRAVRVEASGMGVRVWYVTTFRPAAHGTRVEVTGDYDLPIRFAPAAVDRLVAERVIGRDIERAHAALQDLCIAEEGVPASGTEPTDVALESVPGDVAS